jgi:hypothetical protein
MSKYQGVGKEKWEDVVARGYIGQRLTNRLRVPGGWLYQTHDEAGDCLAFVPYHPEEDAR